MLKWLLTFACIEISITHFSGVLLADTFSCFFKKQPNSSKVVYSQDNQDEKPYSGSGAPGWRCIGTKPVPW